MHVLYYLTETHVYFWDWEYKYNVTLTTACNSRIVYIVYDDELYMLKGIYFMIYGIISEFTDKGQFQYLTNLKGPQEGTYLYTTQFLSLR